MHIVDLTLPRLAVVIGSNRPGLICPEIAVWVQRGLRTTELNEIDLIDLQELHLPFSMSRSRPHRGRYEYEHTVRWSQPVRSYDGFVFVFSQYNWGYHAVLKNALDFLYHEWVNKPAALVSYRSRGGGLAATQLRQVLQGLHMRSTETNIELKTDETMLTDAGNPTTSTLRSPTTSPKSPRLPPNSTTWWTAVPRPSHTSPRQRNLTHREPS